MDFRKTFDRIPESFDRYRPRYCKELFQELTLVAGLNPKKKVLEIGPGTGQATEPVLKTGCDYTAIELGENFTSFMKNKFGGYENFHIVNADFENYCFEENTYDLVYSAATIQWIPEETAFSKTYKMLKPGGYLAMFMTRSDERTSNIKLAKEIDKVYEKYFHVKQKYNCRLVYENVLNYGFVDLIYKEWKSERILNADEYISYISTHCEHITLEEPYKSDFYAGIRKAVMDAGNEIVIMDTIPLYLAKKLL
ncbi:MAG: class I SAM-dependent methyltransferase [Lachnospiraceae bacterium]|nr:class I SAM-dependent methyltransferase [Lachnospiraceae bacterium]